jgi:hypothetical protein
MIYLFSAPIIIFSGKLKRKAKQRAKQRAKRKANPILVFLILAIAISAIFYFIPAGKIGGRTTSTSLSGTTSGQWNCGDMQIDINSIKEAAGYYRFGIQKPAAEGYKFEVLSLAVANKADAAKDFSGYRIQLIAGSKAYMPVAFSEIEKIVLMDKSTIDYSCEELKLASISRFELGAGESSTGCKIFQMLKDYQPTSLAIYDAVGLKCTVQIE